MYRPTGSFNSANFGRSVILSIGDNLFFYLYGCLNIKDYTQERKNLQYTEDLKYVKFIEKKRSYLFMLYLMLEMVKYINERIY